MIYGDEWIGVHEPMISSLEYVFSIEPRPKEVKFYLTHHRNGYRINYLIIDDQK